ncbi:hypothetical protein U1Q18_017131 [Sarracenia purpurea var. burkii]
MDYQQAHRYMRPPPSPPPSTANPYHQLPLAQPLPPPGPWYHGQFQYQPPSQHSPSPPPPHQQWAPPPPPHADYNLPPPYAAPPPHPHYPARHLHDQYQLPTHPPHRQTIPPFHSHSQISQAYPQVIIQCRFDMKNVNEEGKFAMDVVFDELEFADPERLTMMKKGEKEMIKKKMIDNSLPVKLCILNGYDQGNANWGHHQAWEYPDHHNEEDWAAKARAWAAAKVTTDYQHSPTQFTPVDRLDEQSHYRDPYPQTADGHYPDVLQPSLPAPGYQQYPTPAAPSHRLPVVHPQESAPISSGQSPFVSDMHLAYTARDGILAVHSNAFFPRGESSPSSSSVHLQEVPSSYSSVTGIEPAGDQNEKFYKSFPLPIDSNQGPHHVHLPLPAAGRSVSMEQPQYTVDNQSAKASTDNSSQPLEFSSRLNHNYDPLTQPNYIRTDIGGPMRGADPPAAGPSKHTWTPPAVLGTVYPPIPPVLQSRQQHDPSIALSSPVSGHPTPLFGRMAGPSFQPIPSVGTPFGIGVGSGFHPTPAFPSDAYGVSSVPDRPKKASVPNWLREEIIKNKAVIVCSASEHPKEDTESIEDEAVDKSLEKADQADSKSIESSKSTEEEDDGEDYVEAARMAAINQEIKHILTEVLLKVTDELFGEIATKILSEGDLTVEVDENDVSPNDKLSPSAPAVQTPKASAMVLLPVKSKGAVNETDYGKSASSTSGDVLGLASYASDDNEDDNSTVLQHPNTQKPSEGKDTDGNGRSQMETKGHAKHIRNAEGDVRKTVLNGSTVHYSAIDNELSVNRTGRGSSDGNLGSRNSSEMISGVEEDEDNFHGEKRPESIDASGPNDSVREKDTETAAPLETNSAKRSVTDDSQGKEIRNKQNKNGVCETKTISSGKDIDKEVESGRDRIGEREDDKRRGKDERHSKKESTGDRNSSKDRVKEQGGKSREKVRESDLRKRSIHPDGKEDRKEKMIDKRSNADRRTERTNDDKGERLRHKLVNESSRHKRHRTSSVGSRGRSSKDNSVFSHANGSSDESSDDSKRKMRSKRRNLSSSPSRSRRRYSVFFLIGRYSVLLNTNSSSFCFITFMFIHIIKPHMF